MIYIISDFHCRKLSELTDLKEMVDFSNGDAITVFGHTPTTFYGEKYKGKQRVAKYR